jgi:hypothetical protein
LLNRPSAEGLPAWSDHSQVAVAIDEVLPLAKLGHPGGSDVNGFPKLKAIQLTQDVNSKSSTAADLKTLFNEPVIDQIQCVGC